MRIALLNWTSRRVGGTETYLETLMPSLERHGHEVAYCHEVDVPATRDPLRFGAGVTVIPANILGADAALARLRDWQPDVLYAHGFVDPELEARTLDIAPAVFFAHSYYGTCISGNKAFALPARQPCGKAFGAACLLHYYPRRCGGLNPVTMLTDFQKQRRRLQLLPRYRLILTHSAHMQREYERYPGLKGRVRTCLYTTDSGPPPPLAPDASRASLRPNREVRLAFVGRMDRLKGVDLLLQALPVLTAALRRPIEVDLIGAGPETARLEAIAAHLLQRHEGLRIKFRGWSSKPEVRDLLERSDVLVVPSVWPEPFGLVGLEAARLGVPAVAFDVGGITEWLKDGVNGVLAPADPPTARGLAEAIGRCFTSAEELARLQEGARRMAGVLDDWERHLHLLLAALTAAADMEAAG